MADPPDASVAIHERDRAPHRLTAADTVDGAPLLPAFRLPVTDVFTL